MDSYYLLVENLTQLPGETEWIELKHNNCDPEVIGQTISALANGAVLADKDQAYLLWGIDDATHQVLGTTFDPLQTKIKNQEFHNWIRGHISDNTALEFHVVDYRGQKVVVLTITKAQGRPATFRNVEYIRVGSYKKKLSEEPSLQALLWDKLLRRDFESEAAVAGLRLEEALSLLDTDTYFRLLGQQPLSQNQEKARVLLREELLTHDDDGTYSVTNLGAVLLAKDLQDFPSLRRKKVRVIRYFGDDKLQASKETTVDEGYALGFSKILQTTQAFVPSKETINADGVRKTADAYPVLSLREAVANALIHQDFHVRGAGPLIEIFDTRLEITNPGKLLVDPLRILDSPPRSRNEKLAGLMRRMGMCEERGSGWDKIAAMCELAELPAPHVRNLPRDTQVVFYVKKPFEALSMVDRMWACYLHASLKFLGGQDFMSNQSLRQRFGLPVSAQPQISKLIKRTVEDGLIKPQNPQAAPRFMRYIPVWAN